MKPRALLPFALGPLLLGNGLIVHTWDLAEPLDLHWLATNCTALPEATRSTLPELVEVDHELFDVDYYGPTFLARRSALSMALCLPGLGCVIPLVVQGTCLG